MTLWFVFVVISSINLVLGVLCAIYVRRKLEHSAPQSDVLTSDDRPESLSKRTVADGGPTGADWEAISGRSADISETDFSAPHGPEGETPGQGSEHVGTGATGRFEVFGEGFPETAGPEHASAPSNGSSAEEKGEPDTDRIGVTQTPLARHDVGQETTPVGDPSVLWQLMGEIQEVIAEFRQLHDRWFLEPPTDREQLALLLGVVGPVVQRVVNAYHNCLPALVEQTLESAVDDLLGQLQEEILTAQSIEARIAALDVRGDFAVTLRTGQAECGRLLSALHAVRDCVEAIMAADLLHRQVAISPEDPACYDPVTGLYNRLGVARHCATQGWANMVKDHVAAAIFDIDQFRRVNERFGHPWGDAVLRAITGQLKELVAQKGVLARYGGDQFLMLISGGTRRAVQLAERFRQQMELTTFTLGSESIQLTLSVAITDLRSDDTMIGFFQRLEETLKEAKKAGGNRTFTHEGRSASPLVPPNLQVETRSCQVPPPSEIEQTAPASSASQPERAQA